MEPAELLTKRRIEKLASVEFIRKVLLFLYHAKGGMRGYVDWQDTEMEHETDAKTAADLKSRIQHARKVIYVVTTESLKSVWCSWEIGFADCAKGPNDIAILAIKPNNGRWKNHEYLQQYPWISYDQDKRLFMVTKPDGKRLTLYNWLS
jgi:hypothetical protein